jgi:hypothetical protein
MVTADQLISRMLNEVTDASLVGAKIGAVGEEAMSYDLMFEEADPISFFDTIIYLNVSPV